MSIHTYFVMEDTLLVACRRELGLKISFISPDNMMNVSGDSVVFRYIL